MWPFKPKVSIEGFCEEFYSSYIFRPMAGDKYSTTIPWDTAVGRIREADDSISTVEREVFLREFNALRVELFSLAWVHQQEEHVLRQTQYTPRFLAFMGRSETWDIINYYNQAVATAPDEATGNRRARLWTKWIEAQVDPACAARAANRLGTEQAWGQGVIASRLAAAFQQRIGCQLSLEGDAGLKAVIEDVYEEALKAIRSVRVKADLEI